MADPLPSENDRERRDEEVIWAKEVSVNCSDAALTSDENRERKDERGKEEEEGSILVSMPSWCSTPPKLDVSLVSTSRSSSTTDSSSSCDKEPERRMANNKEEEQGQQGEDTSADLLRWRVFCFFFRRELNEVPRGRLMDQ